MIRAMAFAAIAIGGIFFGCKNVSLLSSNADVGSGRGRMGRTGRCDLVCLDGINRAAITYVPWDLDFDSALTADTMVTVSKSERMTLSKQGQLDVLDGLIGAMVGKTRGEGRGDIRLRIDLFCRNGTTKVVTVPQQCGWISIGDNYYEYLPGFVAKVLSLAGRTADELAGFPSCR